MYDFDDKAERRVERQSTNDEAQCHRRRSREALAAGCVSVKVSVRMEGMIPLGSDWPLEMLNGEGETGTITSS